MMDAAGGGGAFGFGDGPGFRGGGDEELAAGGADLAQRDPIRGSGGAAAGALHAVFGFVEIGLFDADEGPEDVELFGDEHGHAVFYALTDFGIFSHDGDLAGVGNFDES